MCFSEEEKKEKFKTIEGVTWDIGSIHVIIFN